MSNHSADDAADDSVGQSTMQDRPPTVDELARMSNAELELLGVTIDDTVVHIVSPAPPPGSSAEKRAERQVALAFLLATFFALAFVFVFWGAGWFLPDWEYTVGGPLFGSLFTPLLGLTMGGALLFFGVGIVLWTKKLMPHEMAVQQRHDGGSDPVDARTAGGTIMSGFERTGFSRHKIVRRAILGAAGALGLLAVMPLGGLIKKPGASLFQTSWGAGVRLLRADGTPVRPSDMLPGSLETVFPAVEDGNREADASTMLIRLLRTQADDIHPAPGQQDFGYEDYLAFSKICTHAGCPVSLYEKQTARILCPCHQSQFDVTRGASPVFGPAARPLPQLPIDVDSDGFFVARGDYPEPVGPSFWTREK